MSGMPQPPPPPPPPPPPAHIHMGLPTVSGAGPDEIAGGAPTAADEASPGYIDMGVPPPPPIDPGLLGIPGATLDAAANPEFGQPENPYGAASATPSTSATTAARPPEDPYGHKAGAIPFPFADQPTPVHGIVPFTDSDVPTERGTPDAEEQKHLDDLARNHPEEFQRVKELDDLARMHGAALNVANENARARRAAEDDLAARQFADQKTQMQMSDVMAESQKLAGTKIDNGRWMKNADTGQKAGAWIAAIMGGLVAGKTGGRNDGMAAIDHLIDQDIESQKIDMQNAREGLNFKKSALMEQFQRTGNMYQAEQTVKAAAHLSILNDYAARASDLDPNGTSAKITLAEGMQNWRGAMIKQAQDRDLVLRKQNVEEAKVGLSAKKDAEEAAAKAAQLAEEIRAHQATEGIEGYKASIENQKRKDAKGQVFTPDQLAQLHPEPGQPIPKIPMSEKDYGAWLEGELKGQQSVKGKQENAVNLAKGQIRNPQTGAPLTVDGNPASAPLVADEKTATDVNDKLVASQNLADSFSTAIRVLDSNPHAWSRTKWAQQGTELENGLINFAKLYDLKFSSREKEALEDIVGPDFKHISDRITQQGPAKERLQTLLNIVKRQQATTLKTKAGFLGDPSPLLLDTSKPGEPVKSDVDALLERATDDLGSLKTADLGVDDREYLSTDEPTKFSPPEQGDRGRVDRGAVQRSLDLKIAPSQLKALDELHDRALGGDSKAVDALDQVQRDGNSHAMKVYATGLVRSLAQEQMNRIPTGEP